MSEAEIVRVWEDGWRLAVVLSRGPAWITVLPVGSLSPVKVEARAERTALRPPVGSVSTRRMIGIIDRRARSFRKHRHKYAKADTKRALALLRDGGS